MSHVLTAYREQYGLVTDQKDLLCCVEHPTGAVSIFTMS